MRRFAKLESVPMDVLSRPCTDANRCGGARVSSWWALTDLGGGLKINAKMGDLSVSPSNGRDTLNFICSGDAEAHSPGLPWMSVPYQVRPGSRVVTSWTSHALPSGSLKEQNDP